MSGSQFVEAPWVTELREKAALHDQLISVLSRHCGERGDNEGAVETLERIIRERDAANLPASGTRREG